MVATCNTFFTFYEHHTFSRLKSMSHDTPHLDMVQSCKALICNLFCALVKIGVYFKFSFALWLFVNCDPQVVVCLDCKSRLITPFQFQNRIMIDKLQLMFVIHEAPWFLLCCYGFTLLLMQNSKLQFFCCFVIVILFEDIVP